MSFTSSLCTVLPTQSPQSRQPTPIGSDNHPSACKQDEGKNRKTQQNSLLVTAGDLLLSFNPRQNLNAPLQFWRLRSKFQFRRLRDLRSENTTITNKKFRILEMNSRPIPISSAKWDSLTLAYFSPNKILLLSALSFHATLGTEKWGRSWAR